MTDDSPPPRPSIDVLAGGDEPVAPPRAPARPPAAVTGWRPGSWPWDLKVQRFLWIGGTLLLLVPAGIGYALAVGDDGLALTLGSVASMVALLVIGGWGMARWMTDRRHPTDRVAGWFGTILVWVALVYLLQAFIRFVLLAILPAWPLELGMVERLVLAPALVALLMSVAGKLRLHLYVSRVAAFFTALAFAVGQSGAADQSAERASVASATALAKARASGDPIVLRGIDLYPGQSVSATRAPDARCQRARAYDRRRTHAGIPGRVLDVWFEACWDDRGRAVSVASVQRANRGDEVGRLQPLRLRDPSVFELAAYDPALGYETFVYPGSYGDRAADLVPADADVPSVPGDETLPLIDDRGRVQDDERSANDALVARVTPSPDGDIVEVVSAYESRDPLAPLSDDEEREAARTVTPWRILHPYTRRGRAVDLVTANLTPAGGGAYVTRYTATGREALVDGNHPGGR